MDIDDAFDSLVLAEDRLREDGRQKGIDHGRIVGFTEGYVAGIDKGSKVAAELGFMWGFCSVLQAMLAKEGKKERALKAVGGLLDSIASFPVSDPTVETFVEDLERIRTKFRQISAMLHIPRTVEGDSLSF